MTTGEQNTIRRPTKEEALRRAFDEGNRVRLLIGSRKMKLPGVLARTDVGFRLDANWGRSWSVPTDHRLKEIEIADDRGRYNTVTTDD